MKVCSNPIAADCRTAAMLTEIYIEALLADEVLADHVWVAWGIGISSTPFAIQN